MCWLQRSLLLSGLAAALAFLLGRPPPPSHVLQLNALRGTGAVEPLHSFQGVLYYGTLSLDGQNFDVVFDTGSSDTWLLAAGARRPPGSSGLGPGYRGNSSSSSLSLSYGSGRVSGRMARDTVQLGDLQLELDFLAAEDVASLGDVFAQGHLHGLVGLGFPSLSYTGKPSLLERLRAEGLVAARQFSFVLDAPGPRLALGGVDPSLQVAALSWLPLTAKGYWQFQLDQASVGATVVGPYARCIVDSGSSYLLASSVDVERLAAALGAQRRGSSSWSTPSSAAPPLLLRAGGLVFRLDPRDLEVNGELALMAYDSPDGVATFILGDAFLRRYSVVFDAEGAGRLAFVQR